MAGSHLLLKLKDAVKECDLSTKNVICKGFQVLIPYSPLVVEICEILGEVRSFERFKRFLAIEEAGLLISFMNGHEYVIDQTHY
jgi:hypothetical protein